MNTDMSPVMSILGAGLIALLGFVLHGIRASLKTLTTDMAGVKTDLAEVKTDVTSLKTDVGSLKVQMAEVKTDLIEVRKDLTEVKTSLVRVETTQKEHSRRLDRMADQGERIATLEGALTITA